jgi:hypothetical protein
MFISCAMNEMNKGMNIGWIYHGFMSFRHKIDTSLRARKAHTRHNRMMAEYAPKILFCEQFACMGNLGGLNV